MMSISKFQTSEQASNYFQNDIDYYTKNEEVGEFWGSEVLLKEFEIEDKTITKESYEKFAELSNFGNGKRAGFDLTFSAPKSVSLAYFTGDEKLRENILKAQDRAVNEALEFSKNYIQQNYKENGELKKRNVEHLIGAKFNHFTNRNEEPQLHTHSFIFNITKFDDKPMKSLENRKLYKNQKLITQIYHNVLKQELQKIGLEMEVKDLKKDMLELKGANNELIDKYSSRSKEIKEEATKLKEQYKNTSEAKLKEMATLSSRKAKGYQDLESIINNTKKEILQSDKKFLSNIYESSKAKKEEFELSSKNELINKTLKSITEQEVSFTKERFLSEALKFNLLAGKYHFKEFEKEIEDNKEIVKLKDNIFTTKEMQRLESQILIYSNSTRENKEALSTSENVDNFISQNYSTMTQGQQEATKHILTTKSNVNLIQGDAGTGKTYMLRAVREHLSNRKDVELVGLSFTGKASEAIEKESGIKSFTLHSYLNSKVKEEARERIYIVDEASMIGARQLKQLIDKAELENAKIVLIGDTKQFQSIQASSIFKELQNKSNLKTVEMSETMRAKTKEMKELYNSIKEKDFNKSFEILGENLKELKDGDKSQIVEKYLKDSENTLLIASKNRDRKELNELIREKLNLKDSISLNVKESQNLSSVEKHHSNSYKSNQKIFIQQAFKDDDMQEQKGFKAGDEFTIKEVKENRIILDDDREIDLKKFGDKFQVFEENRKEFAKGEKIIFTKNDKMLNVKNGEIGIIQNIDNKGNLKVLVGEDKEVSFNIDNYNYIDYGYSITDYKAQGQTSEKVIALSDSQQANFNSFYVQVTRAKEEIEIFTNDIELFKSNVQEEQEKSTTLESIKVDIQNIEIEESEGLEI